MGSHNLQYLLAPRSVAVIGASDRAGSVGATVMRNLINGGFAGPIWPVNLRRATVAGRRAYAAPADLPEVADLAVVCTPGAGIPALIGQLGARGTRAAIVLSAGSREPGPRGGTWEAAMLEAARPFGLRILGPNCIGLLAPGIGLNASFSHVGAHAGNLAFIVQSGALTSAMLDWAHAAGVGFSHCVSLGNASDVDFGDLLDYLGRSPQVGAILLYIESITHARKFMSAARAAARNKPVIAVKAGRSAQAAQVATSHSGALAGVDLVYEAALRRAGVLRVDTTRQLFDAARTLAQPRPFLGPRLGLVSNGGGPAVLATDALIAGGGELATLSAETVRALDACLPAAWSRGNPVDIIGDAQAPRYLEALERVLADPNVDALLLIHAPTALASTSAVARACAPLLKAARKPTFACWLGAEGAGAAGSTGSDALTGYTTPEEAVDAFLQVVHYHQLQSLLPETPRCLPDDPGPDPVVVRSIIGKALAERRSWLSEPESKAVLAAYGIPVVEARAVPELGGLRAAAAAIGYPVALKILSPDITHKSEVGGVALDLAGPEDLERAATIMLERCRAHRPQARMQGFTVQRMIRRSGALELLAGIATDRTFGPVILFGSGGTAAEAIGDRAVALPPLNSVLARELIGRTRIARVLVGARGRASVDLRGLEAALIRLAQLAADIAEIAELDINPLLAHEQGVIALDARVRVVAASGAGLERLAISPDNNLDEVVLDLPAPSPAAEAAGS